MPKTIPNHDISTLQITTHATKARALSYDIRALNLNLPLLLWMPGIWYKLSLPPLVPFDKLMRRCNFLLNSAYCH